MNRFLVRCFSFSSPRLVPLALLAVSSGFCANPCVAQGNVEIFGGYSYMRVPVDVGQSGSAANIAQSANLNGWEVAGEVKLLPFIGVVADFDGTYGALDGAATHENTFLFGPQLSLPGKFSVFLHALGGVAHESQAGISGSSFVSLGSDTSWAAALGGGVDVKAIPFVRIRLIQVDYIRTALHGAMQSQPRISAGIVLHF